MSRRYSSISVWASYSGWPWKKTNRLLRCLTNASTPAASDRVSTRYPHDTSASSGISFHRECGIGNRVGASAVRG